MKLYHYRQYLYRGKTIQGINKESVGRTLKIKRGSAEWRAVTPKRWDSKKWRIGEVK